MTYWSTNYRGLILPVVVQGIYTFLTPVFPNKMLYCKKIEMKSNRWGSAWQQREGNKLKKKYLVLVASLLIGSVFIAMLNMPSEARSKQIERPIVFVHGYKGTANSFGNMLTRFENKDWGKKALIYRVTPKGKLKTTYLGKAEGKPAFVQVIFENNRASFQDTTEWLAKVLGHLKEVHRVDSIHLVGHSMGGIVSVKYTSEYSQGDQYPAVDRLVVLGSPFDGIYNQAYFQIHQDAAAEDLKRESASLELLRANQTAFPEQVKVLSIGSTGDSVTTVESIQSLEKIVPANQLQEIMITDPNLGHSDLHESLQVDQAVYDFLSEDELSEDLS